MMRTAVGLPTMAKKSAGLSASRLKIYICVVLFFTLGASV